jgi:flagellar biosynthetic protein FliR
MTLVILSSGLYREILLGLLRTFTDAPLGGVSIDPRAGLAVVNMLSGALFAALQLAAPVIAATVLAEIAVATIGKLSPQLPVMMVAIPAKTLLGYVVMIGSLARWPRFLERHFSLLLDNAQSLVRHAIRIV